MKTRFSTVDIISIVAELQSLLHMRVVNVYDIDNKTYFFKLSRREEKALLLIESGSRIHKTEFEWPKNVAPSGFTMKLRKHIHNRRLEKITQLGIDRIVDLQFGCNEAAYHVILELYDKGNIVLTDFEYEILNVLRPRTENETTKFVVHEKYPIHKVKQSQPALTAERIREILMEAKQGESIRKILNPHLEFGPALIDHVLLGSNYPVNGKMGKNFALDSEVPRLMLALEEAEHIFKEKLFNEKGYIIKMQEKKTSLKTDNDENIFYAYNEFHPYLFRQHENQCFDEFPSFNKAVDEYFSRIESQKLDMKTIQKEREALKKLENVKKDHQQRLGSLQKIQEEDKHKAELIEMNLDLVQSAILVVQNAIANQLQWKEISNLIQEAAQRGDSVAKIVKALKLEINNITLSLSDPYGNDADSNRPMLIDIDLDLTAYANAKRYYDKKRRALMKEQKTIESSEKAYKSAEKRTKQTLKEAATISTINKLRKSHWFEKFLWFISSENYLVIGGRDQQQNELIVKRYMKMGDIYVHADIHGASSIIIKNSSGEPVPPRTLNEAGTMAVCSSAAWESKVVTSAWWVHRDQVSKTAPTGEYLTTGSFMIRGKKNYLPPCYLIMGFGFLFKLDEESIVNHKDERRVKSLENSSDFSLTIEEENENENEESLVDEGNGSENEELPENLEETSTSEVHIDDDDDDNSTSFPDTAINLEFIQGEKLFIKTQSVGSKLPHDVSSAVRKVTHELLNGVQKKKPCHETPNKKDICKVTESAAAPSAVQMKRGQKYKLKKMKEKYRDQDEEDRQLAMAILQPAGEKKKSKKEEAKYGGKNKGQKNQVIKQSSSNENSTTSRATTTPTLDGPKETNLPSNKIEEEIEILEDEADAKQQAIEDASLLAALTGIPTVDDILLFAVPVCAPYNALLNYKYKVKISPGTTKRGKAAKTALNLFLHDKNISTRERDLLRSVKDQDISRNLPGKVKLSSTFKLKQK
uniref:Nuclear export mediator factor NEMF n=1 Tax=Hemiscolopendra marginata TaxID=943146 RepID=A0A646QDP9_9MYRI